MADGEMLLKGGMIASVDGEVVPVGGGDCGCCDEQPPQEIACTIPKWGRVGVPPENAAYSYDFSETDVPECISATLYGSPFDGTYDLYPASFTLGEPNSLWYGVYYVPASYSMPLRCFKDILHPNSAYLLQRGSIWAGAQYRITIHIYLGADGIFNTDNTLSASPNTQTYVSISEIGLSSPWPNTFWNVPAGVDPEVYRGARLGSSIIPFGSNVSIWDFPTQAKSLSPFLQYWDTANERHGLLMDDVGSWNLSFDLTGKGKFVRVYNGVDDSGCGNCGVLDERPKNRGIVATPNKALTDGTWRATFILNAGTQWETSWLIPSDKAGSNESCTHQYSANGFTHAKYVDKYGTSFETGFLQSNFVTRFNGDYNGGAQMSTVAQHRVGTVAPDATTYGGFGGCTAYQVEIPGFDGLYVSRTTDTFRTSPTTFEVISYWRIFGLDQSLEAAVHTQPIPFTSWHAPLYSNCLPNNCTLSCSSQYLGTDGKGVPTYHRVARLNGTVIYQRYSNTQFCYSPATVTAGTRYYGDGSGWAKTAGGFGDSAQGGIVFSLNALPSAPYYAHPYCGGSMVTKLASGAEEDEIAQRQTITLHLNEPFSTTMQTRGTSHLPPYMLVAILSPDTSGVGFLPPGLDWHDSGVISGTPTTEGEWEVKGLIRSNDCMTWSSWCLKIIVKVRDPEFQYDPQGFTSGGTNDQGVDWYMRDGDSGTIEANAHWGTTPYVMSYTGDALDGASFNTSTGDWVLSPAHTQVGNTSGTVTMKLLDDTNKTDYVTKTWFRLGGTPPI